MAAKKRSTRKKRVTVEIDPEALFALLDAVNALRETAEGLIFRIGDPEIERAAKKRAKKKRGR